MGMLSGGLAGLSRFWWLESGGFDSKMMGWGGENIDQGVRMWVCGGEIVAAPHSQVAHMWRTHSAKTSAHYKRVGDTLFNRARAIKAWLQEFSDKLYDYPAFASRKAASGEHWIGETCSNWLLWTAFFFPKQFCPNILEETLLIFGCCHDFSHTNPCVLKINPLGNVWKKPPSLPVVLESPLDPEDMSTFENVRKRLNGCRPFAWYLKRFKAVYEDAGLIPPEIFMIREDSSFFFSGKSVEPDYLLKIFERKALRYISCHH